MITAGVKVEQTNSYIHFQIAKSYGTDDETSTSGQNPMTRAMVAVEMMSLNSNGIMDFKVCYDYLVARYIGLPLTITG